MKDHPVQQHKAASQESASPEAEGKGKSLMPPAFQLKASEGPAAPPPASPKSNNGGLPGELVSGFAASTGHDLSNVNVVRNSDKPAQVGALAFAQGNDIHLAAGQDQHLAHEAAHIVQQREGRVQATTEVNGKPVNDSKHLESEADAMGAKAMQMKGAGGMQLSNTQAQGHGNALQAKGLEASNPALQMVRRLRTDYPWEGVVTAANAVLQDQPVMASVAGASLPIGTRLHVLARSGEFLQVETMSAAASMMSGSGTRGYVHESMIDDLVSHQISSEMVGEQRVWNPSGPVTGAHPANTDFARSASTGAGPVSTIGAHAPTGAGFSAGTANSSLNCWELLLLAALQVGLIDRNYLQQLYATAGADYQTAWISRMTSGAASTYLVGNPATPRPASGHVVFFNNLSHVVLATGETNSRGESEVYSFWPPAGIRPADIVSAISAHDPTLYDRLHRGRVEVTTIERLSGWMAESDRQPILHGSGAGNAPVVTFYAPSW